MTNNEPDLSFTQNDDWIKERKALWATIEKELKSDFRKRELATIEYYMLTGQKKGDYRMSDGGLVTYYPLANKNGWDYTYEHYVWKPITLKEEFYTCIRGSAPLAFGENREKQLEYFDYYHPTEFQPVLKSNVPIAGEYQEFEVDCTKLLSSMVGTISLYLAQGSFAPCLFRQSYFFSALANFVADDENRKSQSLEKMMKKIIGGLLDLPFKRKDFSPERLNGDLMQEFRSRLDSSDLPEVIKTLWEESKKEAGVS